MRKIILFIVIILIHYRSAAAQNSNICDELYYTLTVDIGFGIIEKTDYLMKFNKDVSYSKEINIMPTEGINKIKSETTQKKSIIVPKRTNITPRFFYNTLDDFYYMILSDESVIVKDDKSQWDWEIHTETKTIEGYICKKATIDFHGKSYIAWFTDEIEVPFGPWKLQNLPGLIIEIESPDKSLQVKATKINISKDSNCNINFEKKQLEKALTIPELNEKRKEVIKALKQKMKNKYKMLKSVKEDEECKECPKGIEKYDKK